MTDLKTSAGLIRGAGRHGDTVLAHINPIEAQALQTAGGSGTINPKTGLPEYSFFTSIRDAFESVAVVVGNYFLPGSSIVTSQLVSKGSQEQLNSTVGRIATMASGVAGGAAGNLSNYGKLLNSVGLNAVTNGINNVSEYLSSTLNSLSGDATGPVANAAVDATGSAAGNVAGGGADTVAQTVAQNSGVTTPSPAELIAGNELAPEVGKQIAKPGLINGVMNWANKNPIPALMAGQTVMSTIGGIGTAEANRETARLNRETQLQMPAVQRQANMVQGGWGSQAPPIQAADPAQALTMDGKYIYGPNAGQYAPGRGPGIIGR